MMERKRNISPHPVRHVPRRTCLACRQIKAKQELIRLVRIADDRVEVDPSGKKVGRGAYLCRARQCWETGLKGDRLEHTLRTRISQDNRQDLVRFGEDWLKECVSGQGK